MSDETTLAKRAETRAEVIAVLQENADAIRGFGATALYLFGSAARDEMGPNSDVDMFVDYRSGGPFTYDSLFDLKHMLEQKLDREVDLLTRASLHPRLKTFIEAEALRLL